MPQNLTREITKLLTELKIPRSSSDVCPSPTDWVLIDITPGRQQRFTVKNRVQEHILAGSTYLLLPTKEAAEFGHSAGGRFGIMVTNTDSPEETVKRWRERMRPPPEFSEDGRCSTPQTCGSEDGMGY